MSRCARASVPAGKQRNSIYMRVDDSWELTIREHTHICTDPVRSQALHFLVGISAVSVR